MQNLLGYMTGRQRIVKSSPKPVTLFRCQLDYGEAESEPGSTRGQPNIVQDTTEYSVFSWPPTITRKQWLQSLRHEPMSHYDPSYTHTLGHARTPSPPRSILLQSHKPIVTRNPLPSVRCSSSHSPLHPRAALNTLLSRRSPPPNQIPTVPIKTFRSPFVSPPTNRPKRVTHRRIRFQTRPQQKGGET